jgi:hypothetical protein
MCIILEMRDILFIVSSIFSFIVVCMDYDETDFFFCLDGVECVLTEDSSINLESEFFELKEIGKTFILKGSQETVLFTLTLNGECEFSVELDVIYNVSNLNV